MKLLRCLWTVFSDSRKRSHISLVLARVSREPPQPALPPLERMPYRIREHVFRQTEVPRANSKIRMAPKPKCRDQQNGQATMVPNAVSPPIEVPVN